jgi:hypothetical protein
MLEKNFFTLENEKKIIVKEKKHELPIIFSSVKLSQLSNLKISTESQRYVLNSEHRKILLSFKSLVKVKIPK